MQILFEKIYMPFRSVFGTLSIRKKTEFATKQSRNGDFFSEPKFISLF